MTLLEMKKKILRFIEEIDEEHAKLTQDPDIAAKLNDVINMVQNELARMKKIPAVAEDEEVVAGEPFELNSLPDFYQLRLVRFKNAAGEETGYQIMDNLVIFAEDGNATFYYYKYPEMITDETVDAEYEFELSQDALEIMPCGVAADLLKTDVSTNYGKIFADRYETMLQRLDSRISMPTVSIEGGYDI